MILLTVILYLFLPLLTTSDEDFGMEISFEFDEVSPSSESLCRGLNCQNGALCLDKLTDGKLENACLCRMGYSGIDCSTSYKVSRFPRLSDNGFIDFYFPSGLAYDEEREPRWNPTYSIGLKFKPEINRGLSNASIPLVYHRSSLVNGHFLLYINRGVVHLEISPLATRKFRLEKNENNRTIIYSDPQDSPSGPVTYKCYQSIENQVWSKVLFGEIENEGVFLSVNDEVCEIANKMTKISKYEKMTWEQPYKTIWAEPFFQFDGKTHQKSKQFFTIGNFYNNKLVQDRASHDWTPFIGCIDELTFNGLPLDPRKTAYLGDSLRAFGVGNCQGNNCPDSSCGKCRHISAETSECLCELHKTGPYCREYEKIDTPKFKGNSFIRYSIEGSIYSPYYDLVTIEFFAERETGLLFYISNGNLIGDDMMALYLIGGRVFAMFEFGSGPFFIKSEETITLNKWTTARLRREANSISLRLKLDEAFGKTVNSYVTLSKTFSSWSMNDLWLGGHRDVDLMSKWLPREILRPKKSINDLPKDLSSFYGCILKFQMNGINILDRTMDRSRNPLEIGNLLNCKENQCMRGSYGNLCKDGEECLPNADDHQCLCERSSCLVKNFGENKHFKLTQGSYLKLKPFSIPSKVEFAIEISDEIISRPEKTHILLSFTHHISLIQLILRRGSHVGLQVSRLDEPRKITQEEAEVDFHKGKSISLIIKNGFVEVKVDESKLLTTKFQFEMNEKIFLNFGTMSTDQQARMDYSIGGSEKLHGFIGIIRNLKINMQLIHVKDVETMKIS